MAKELRWTRAASQDLDRQIAIISEHSPENAERWANEVLDAASRLRDFPELGRKVPELARFRELIIGMSCRLVYCVRGNTVFISRLLHSRQDFRSGWSMRKP